MNKLEKYLKNSITEESSVEDMLGIFEKGCQPIDEEDMLLFETGTFGFTGEPLFYFSVVKQTENNDGEYIQTHLDVMFKPDNINKSFKDELWCEEEETDGFFNCIRNSAAFKYANSHSFYKIEIFTDET